jgi:hypothetical protein
MSSSLKLREQNKTFQERLIKTQNTTFKKSDSAEFCLAELDEVRRLCTEQNPIYNWSDRNNGGFWKRTWELIMWGFLPSQSGNLVNCYRNAIKDFNKCISTDVSVKTRMFDYVDDWLIPHKMGNCNGIVVPNTQSEKILGCDGRTKAGITNPRYNQSKGKVVNCDTNLPNDQWCACAGYPYPNTEANWNNTTFKCDCNNPSFVPHFHYQHELRGADGRPLTCCGPQCNYGYEFDCIERKCKESLYTFET